MIRRYLPFLIFIASVAAGFGLVASQTGWRVATVWTVIVLALIVAFQSSGER